VSNGPGDVVGVPRLAGLLAGSSFLVRFGACTRMRLVRRVRVWLGGFGRSGRDSGGF
jgi:hypothetical protein